MTAFYFVKEAFHCNVGIKKERHTGLLGTDGTYPPRWWSLGNWSHRVDLRKLGSTWRLFRLIKCQEVGGDPELLGQGHEQDQSHPDGLSSSPAPKAPPCSPTPSSPGQDPKKVSSKEETETGDRVNVLL